MKIRSAFLELLLEDRRWKDMTWRTGAFFQVLLLNTSKSEGKNSVKLKFLTKDMISTPNLIEFKAIKVFWGVTFYRWARTEPFVQPRGPKLDIQDGSNP